MTLSLQTTTWFTMRVAIRKIDNSDILKASDACEVDVADSDEIVVGDTAIAIGNAQGYGISTSFGIVSVDSEYITMTAADGSTTVSFRVMRTDTAVNSGTAVAGFTIMRAILSAL